MREVRREGGQEVMREGGGAGASTGRLLAQLPAFLFGLLQQRLARLARLLRLPLPLLPRRGLQAGSERAESSTGAQASPTSAIPCPHVLHRNARRTSPRAPSRAVAAALGAGRRARLLLHTRAAAFPEGVERHGARFGMEDGTGLLAQHLLAVALLEERHHQRVEVAAHGLKTRGHKAREATA